jgi:hypothetical protein
MGYTATVYELIRLHKEISARIKQNHEEARRLGAERQHIETVIGLLEPTFDARALEPPRERMQVNDVAYLPKLACHASRHCRRHAKRLMDA